MRSSEQIFIFGLLCCLYSFSKIKCEPCMNQKFHAAEDAILRARFQEESGTAAVMRNIIYWGSNAFDISEQARKNLCTCAIYRKNQIIHEHMDRKPHEISSQMEIEEKEFCTTVVRFFLNLNYCTPMIICRSQGDEASIVKGYKKKCFKKREYDVYVSYVVDDKKGDYLGYITDVDA